MKEKRVNEMIEFSYHGRVYTISADRRWDGQSWQFSVRQLGLVTGSFATAQDALLAGVVLVVQRDPTPPTDLVA